MVYPLRVFLKAENRTAELRLINRTEVTMYLQIEGFSWGQSENGKDVYTESKGLIFYPRILQISPGSERLVRVGYSGRWPEVEKTYRVFVRELPVSEGTDRAFKIAVRIGIPVFVMPEKRRVSFRIIKTEKRKGDFIVYVENTGNVHLMLKKLILRGLDSEGTALFNIEATGWYVLAGRTGVFKVEAPKTQPSGLNRLILILQTRDSEKQIDLDPYTWKPLQER